MAVGSIQGLDNNIINTGLKSESSGMEGIGFGDMLKQAIQDVSTLDKESAQTTEDFISGKTDSIHEVMIAGEKASLALEFTIEIRNKILEAYQEIMRMQV